ncbi:MAG: L-histidine N(alpha)-methyltransferase, partial [Myxococcales bacterium]
MVLPDAHAGRAEHRRPHRLLARRRGEAVSGTDGDDTIVQRDVARGLLGPQKSLPAYLFYDAAGSELYEQITTLPEYYPTRAERSIFATQAADIVAAAALGSPDPLNVIELGAGTATKTQLLLEALVERQGACDFLAIDVSSSALGEAVARLGREAPRVRVRPLVAHHEEAMAEIERVAPRQLALFIGSSIGNYTDEEATRLLRQLRLSLRPGAAFLLGTDLRKSPERMVPAYDDAQGVTAAFNLNLLVRLNRELGADFDPAAFRHVALWNPERSRIEMHLESRRAQDVQLPALHTRVHFGAGERIHTESSVKYDEAHVDRLLAAEARGRERTF